MITLNEMEMKFNRTDIDQWEVIAGLGSSWPNAGEAPHPTDTGIYKLWFRPRPDGLVYLVENFDSGLGCGYPPSKWAEVQRRYLAPEHFHGTAVQLLESGLLPFAPKQDIFVVLEYIRRYSAGPAFKHGNFHLSRETLDRYDFYVDLGSASRIVGIYARKPDSKNAPTLYVHKTGVSVMRPKAWNALKRLHCPIKVSNFESFQPPSTGELTMLNEVLRILRKTA